MVIGFLPLDHRPCTYDFPVQLAARTGAKILLPPKGCISDYKEPPDTKRNIRWLNEIAPHCDALVVSAEQLIHGGLIQSRNTRLSENEQRAILKTLENIKKASPKVKIFLSTVLMRTSISAVSKETLIWWEKMNEYSHLRYKAATEPTAEILEKYETLSREIPEDIISAYLTAREVNHRINKACIELAAKNIADTLFILQEDCAPERIHWLEQTALIKEIENSGLSDRVYLFNGTDEAASELIEKAIYPEGTSAEVVWLSDQTDFMANYEDRPFYENLFGHMKAVNIVHQKGSENVICILPPKKKQGEASQTRSGDAIDYTQTELEAISEKIANLSKAGRRCYLLDLDFANGGNVSLLETLAHTMPISLLWGYSAWNTASNSLGMLLAQILSDKKSASPNYAFTAERILDDGIYQAYVRKEVTEQLIQIGEDAFNIRDREKANRLLKDAFFRRMPQIQKIFGGNAPGFDVSLRWNRLFEAEIFVRRNTPDIQKD